MKKVYLLLLALLTVPLFGVSDENLETSKIDDKRAWKMPREAGSDASDNSQYLSSDDDPDNIVGPAQVSHATAMVSSGAGLPPPPNFEDFSLSLVTPPETTQVSCGNGSSSNLTAQLPSLPQQTAPAVSVGSAQAGATGTGVNVPVQPPTAPQFPWTSKKPMTPVTEAPVPLRNSLVGNLQPVPKNEPAGPASQAPSVDLPSDKDLPTPPPHPFPSDEDSLNSGLIPVPPMDDLGEAPTASRLSQQAALVEASIDQQSLSSDNGHSSSSEAPPVPPMDDLDEAPVQPSVVSEQKQLRNALQLLTPYWQSSAYVLSGFAVVGLAAEIIKWSLLTAPRNDMQIIQRMIGLAKDNQLDAESFDKLTKKLTVVPSDTIEKLHDLIQNDRYAAIGFMHGKVLDDLQKKHAAQGIFSRLKRGANIRANQLRSLGKSAVVQGQDLVAKTRALFANKLADVKS